MKSNLTKSKTIDFRNEIPEDWYEKISPFWKKEDQMVLSRNLEKALLTEELAPTWPQVFRAFQLCRFHDLKVVLLGQDPYPTPGHAHGLAFSVPHYVKPLPKSLTNIIKELKRSIVDYKEPTNGDLSSWAEQGILLMNTILTTKLRKIAAHKNIGWELFTKAVMLSIEHQCDHVVGLFWGKEASTISNSWSDKHTKLITSHPSPLSVYRGFEGCNHFAEVNKILTLKNSKPIQW